MFYWKFTALVEDERKEKFTSSWKIVSVGIQFYLFLCKILAFPSNSNSVYNSESRFERVLKLPQEYL